MASSLSKAVFSNLLKLRFVVSCRPITTSSSHCFYTKGYDDDGYPKGNVLVFNGACPPYIHDFITNANCSQRSIFRNVARQLNLMDKRIGVKPEYRHGFDRWSVGEDEEGLYIVRQIHGLHDRDVKEFAPTRDISRLLHLTQFDTPCPSWDVMDEAKELDQFVESISGMHVISTVRVFCTMRYIPALYIIVGLEGPNPDDPYGGYVRKICLPRRFYKIEDVSIYGNEGTEVIYCIMAVSTTFLQLPESYLSGGLYPGQPGFELQQHP